MADDLALRGKFALVKYSNVDSEGANRSSMSSLVASSTNTKSTQRGARSSNHAWSEPSI